MSDRAPACRDPVLHFDALRLVALREGGRIWGGPCNREREKIIIRAPAHVHSAHAALCCWGKLTAHSQPALRTGLMAPAWRPALCIWGVILDLIGRAVVAVRPAFFVVVLSRRFFSRHRATPFFHWEHAMISLRWRGKPRYTGGSVELAVPLQLSARSGVPP